SLFQHDKSIAQTLTELGSTHTGSELRLRIMDVEHVDRLELQIPPRALKLIFQISRRHAVGASGDLRGGGNPLVDVFSDKVALGIVGNISIEREIARLCTHQNLIATQLTGGDQLLKGGSDVPFGALMTVVDGRIQRVHA